MSAPSPEILFQPSGEEEDYGYANDPYAAQTMLTTYRTGTDVGDADLGGMFDIFKKGGGKAAGALLPQAAAPAANAAGQAGGIGSGWGLAIDGIVGLTTAGLSVGMASSQAKKQREHEENMLEEQGKIAAFQAQAAALAGGGETPWGLILGGVVFLGVAGGGIYWWTKK